MIDPHGRKNKTHIIHRLIATKYYAEMRKDEGVSIKQIPTNEKWKTNKVGEK